MRLLTVKENEAGQRLDKLLSKYMKKAPSSFFYKMLRKKILRSTGKRHREMNVLPQETRFVCFFLRRLLKVSWSALLLRIP